MSLRHYVNILNEATKPKPLLEGIRFGNKEKKKIENNNNDYAIGVEYEFHAADDEVFDSISFDNTDEEYELIDDVDFDQMHDHDEILEALKSEVFVRIEDKVRHHDPMYTLPDGTFYSSEMGTEHNALDVEERFFYENHLEERETNENCITLLDELTDALKVYLEIDNPDTTMYDFNDARMYPLVYLIEIMLELEDTSSVHSLIIEKPSIVTALGMREISDDIADVLRILSELTGESDDVKEIIEVVDSKEEVYRDEFFTELNNYAKKIIESQPSFAIPEITDHVYLDLYDYYVGEKPTSLIHDILKDADIKYDSVEQDSGMVEVITGKLSLSDALANMQKMFGVISENGSTSNESGMHISISTNRWDKSNINYEKLLILLNFDHIHTIQFDERDHVENINKIVDSTLWVERDTFIGAVASSSSIQEVYNAAFNNILNAKELVFNKYQSLNANGYHVHDGHLELRYFGGEDYHERFEDIKHELYRALLVMDISYSDIYEKEFHKAKYLYLNKRVETVFGISIASLKNISNALHAISDVLVELPEDKDTLFKALPLVVVKDLRRMDNLLSSRASNNINNIMNLIDFFYP